MSNTLNEWILTNYNGSFSTGSSDRLPRRKYHSLLTQRVPEKGEPLNWILETLESVNNQALLNLSFESDKSLVTQAHLKTFDWQNGLTWTYQVGDIQIVRKLEIHPKLDVVKINYEFTGVNNTPVVFEIRPLMLVRSWHQLTQENIVFNGALHATEDQWVMEPYEGLGSFYFRTKETQLLEVNQQGHWYKNLFYQIEEDRGYPCTEDAFVPGDWIFKFNQNQKISFYVGTEANPMTKIAKAKKKSVKNKESVYLTDLKAAADSYLIANNEGFLSIIAGYPWFESWGRDTMLALPGLLLATDQLDSATQLLLRWKDFFFEAHKTKKTKEGLNLTGIDTQLLFIRALRLSVEKLKGSKKKEFINQIQPGLNHLINAYLKGEIPWVKIKTEGFWVQAGPFAAGWMDAVIEGVPVTPRHGFAVDLCALWIDCLTFAIEIEESLDTHKKTKKENLQNSVLNEWKLILSQNRSSYTELFWMEQSGYLADVHNGLSRDLSIRPNQLWALAIKEPLLSKADGERLLQLVETDLLTPHGLRTLSPHDPHYIGSYSGNQKHRDLAYHQGTVWPWLLGLYSDAVIAVRGLNHIEKLTPLLDGLKDHFYKEACFGHFSEIFDGDAPWTARGAPAQAWSLSEILRIETLLDNERQVTS